LSAAATPDEVVYGSAKYYALCGVGGILSCGITHTAVTPLDLVKCRIQTNPGKYPSIFRGFKVTLQDDGARGLLRGWAPTCIGYSLQGLAKFVQKAKSLHGHQTLVAVERRRPVHLGLRSNRVGSTQHRTRIFSMRRKFGFYEVFKILYADLLGEENAFLWRTSLYLAASASAEFFADIALCPLEACKVRIQTQPGCSPYLSKVFPQILKQEGLGGLYKGLGPLWGRQIPYTMMKFACFERTVELLYKHVVPKPREQCTKGEQLIVTFIAGYIAGVFCAVVSHPADTIVSKLNQDRGSTAVDVAKKLGFAGLWKGLTPRIIMIGTLTALQWFIYDAVKVWLRLPRPPPPAMPESLKKKLEAQQNTARPFAADVSQRRLSHNVGRETIVATSAV
ncbi:phosphate carrier protein, partial [Tropilaelaps mercedesae]